MIKGSIVALVTPMSNAGDVDFIALEQLIDWHLEQKTDAILVIGSTGESTSLTAREKKQIISRTVAQVARRIPVIAGTGTSSTAAAIEATEAAKNAGADVCLLVTPYYVRPTQEGLFQHFKSIAQTVTIPQIIYNVPSRTGCDLQPATVIALANLKNNIIGLKEATNKVERVGLLREACPQRFALYSGNDATAMEFMLQGGHGVISVTANIAPKVMHNMAAAARYANRAQATELNQALQPLYQVLEVETNPIPVKWALHLMGKISRGIRLPLLALSAHHRLTVQKALYAAGIDMPTRVTERLQENTELG